MTFTAKKKNAPTPTSAIQAFSFSEANLVQKQPSAMRAAALPMLGLCTIVFLTHWSFQKKGYNAFALIYRPGAQTACQDLARAIAFLHKNAAKLGIDMKGYSLWGGSAGARMAAWLGSLGTEYFGEQSYPRPAAVIMQYTGLGEVYGNEPPTYNCVGTNDGIASFKTMERRINAIKANGTDAQIEVFRGLGHGFGLGQGTVAEGWIDNAVKFWEKQTALSAW